MEVRRTTRFVIVECETEEQAKDYIEGLNLILDLMKKIKKGK